MKTINIDLSTLKCKHINKVYSLDEYYDFKYCIYNKMLYLLTTDSQLNYRFDVYYESLADDNIRQYEKDPDYPGSISMTTFKKLIKKGMDEMLHEEYYHSMVNHDMVNFYIQPR